MNTNTKIFAKTLEDKAKEQIVELSNRSEYVNSKIRIMPDAHAGNGCTIGTTMTITNTVCPNLVGVDIGCGVLCIFIGKIDKIDFEKLDNVIRENIPSGFKVYNSLIEEFPGLEDIRAKLEVEDIERAKLSIGTLGGGNHFIEFAQDDEKNVSLVIHSGSRNLGHRLCTFYQGKATEVCNTFMQNDRNKSLDYLSSEEERFGDLFDDYIHDMEIVQSFASTNRMVMARIILEKMGWSWSYILESIHNYIDTEEFILRKGAISARLNEPLIIPINMKDGSIIGLGKGNPDWNYSAPHGAGRLLSRTQAKKTLDLEDVRKSMADIYTTSLHPSTLDEAPMAYKSIDEIVDAIEPTVEIKKIIKPLYNFKAK